MHTQFSVHERARETILRARKSVHVDIKFSSPDCIEALVWTVISFICCFVIFAIYGLLEVDIVLYSAVFQTVS